MPLLSSPRRHAVRRGLATCFAFSIAALLVSACTQGRGADDPSSQQGQNGQPGAMPNGQPGAMPGAMPGGQTPGYGQPGPAGPPQAQAASPLALPCQNDLICGTHKCNMQTGRCNFPCATNADCQGGFSCNTALGPAALCVPGGGGTPQ